MNNTIDPATLAKLAQSKQVAAPAAAQATQVESEIKGSVFFGEFGVFENFMTPSGKVLSFYKGFAIVEDSELIEFAKTLRGVQNVTGKVKLADLPTPPIRKRSRNWAAGASDPTIFNPLELLQRAVTSSSATPHAAASNSSN